MKPITKLNPIDKHDLSTNDMRQLIKCTEDIKTMLSTLTTGQPLWKGIEKIAEQTEKQKKALLKLSSTISKSNMVQHEVKQSEQTPTKTQSPFRRTYQDDDDMSKKILQEHNALMNTQNQMIGHLKVLIERMQDGTGHSVPHQHIEENTLQLKDVMKKLQKNPKDVKPAQQWIGELLRQASNKAFLEYSKGLPEEDMKIQYAQEILTKFRSYVLAVQQLKLEPDVIQKFQGLFQKMSKRTIEFLLYKYPQARNKVPDPTLAERIKEVKKITQPQYDMLRNGKITMDLNKLDAGLNVQLKKMINEFIRETNRIYDTYRDYMKQIFKDEQKKDPSFRFLIGRKIKTTTQQYTKQEVDTPGFFIKNNEILRILIKWIEQLISWFTDPSRTRDNLNGFAYEDTIERVGVDRREEMWRKFQQKNQELNQDFEDAEMFIRTTLSSIINLSKSQIVRKKTYEPVAYLSKQDILIPIVCKYVSETLQCYAVKLINSCLQRTQQIIEDYEGQHAEQAGFKYTSFTVNDLLRCKCTGTKDQILSVYEKLIKKEEAKEIKIIVVKNRLSGPTQDILITYKTNFSYLLCQIQLALSTVSEQINDHFNHFLYEQHRSRHGLICQLAMIINTLDPRRKYLLNNRLTFYPEDKPFVLVDKEVQCGSCKSSSLRVLGNELPYMCGECRRFINAYKYYLTSKECSKCLKKICPSCYIQLLPDDQAISQMLEDLPILNNYLIPIRRPTIMFQSQVIRKELIQLLESQLRYVFILYYRNNIYEWNLKIVKLYVEELEQGQEQVDMDRKKHLLEGFTNKTFNTADLDGAVTLYFKTIHPIREFKHEQIQTIVKKTKSDMDDSGDFQQKYGIQNEYDETNEYGCVAMVHKNNKKMMLFDYNLTKDEIDEMMSDLKMTELIQKQNKIKSGRIVLNGLSLNMDILSEIADKNLVNSLEIANCYVPESADEIDYEKLNQFSKLEYFYMSGLEEYTELHNFVFNKTLVELGINSTELKTFKNVPLVSSVMKSLTLNENCLTGAIPKLDMPALTELDIQMNQLDNMSMLSESKLGNLDKLNLSNNNIKGSLPFLKLNNLRVLVLTDNNISDISQLDKCQLPLLKKLYLGDNEIKGNIPNLSHFPKLELADLRGNQLQHMNSMQSLSLEVLLLDQNHLSGKLSKLTLPKLRVLNIASNKFENLDNFRDSQLSSIQQIYAFDNPFKKFPAVAFEQLEKLVIESNKLLFRYDPSQENDSSDFQVLKCSECQEYIKICSYFYDKEKRRNWCHKCKEAQKGGHLLEVCMVGGTDLMKYA